jgi:hypothetical protein
LVRASLAEPGCYAVMTSFTEQTMDELDDIIAELGDAAGCGCGCGCGCCGSSKQWSKAVQDLRGLVQGLLVAIQESEDQ